jgi:uncharacterized protein (TIGR03437 family)
MSIPVWASAQELNLSRDLVAKGIAASNMTPNDPSLDARPLFQAGMAYASANHIQKVVADRGNYYFLSLNSPYQHVYLKAPTDITVDLDYSNLYFAHSNIPAFFIANSAHFTLKNFTIDYLALSLPFTELKVTKINPVGAAPTLDFTTLPNYPLPSVFNALNAALPSGYVNNGYYAYVFRDGKQLRETGRMAVTGPLNDSTLRLSGKEPWTKAAELNAIRPGDIVVLEWRAGLGTIFSSGSTGLTVRNVSIYSSGFIGVFVVSGSATTIDHVQVIPRPGTDRLISTNADGIHLARARADNRLSDNTVKRCCDDAIAMDGEWYAIVAAASGGNKVQVKLHHIEALPVGKAYDFIDIDNASIVGTATVASESGPDKNGVIELMLDKAVSGLQPQFGVAPHDAELRGSGTVISGNLAQDIVFGRGIYPAGEANISIMDNMIETTNRTGIIVEQDESLWYDYKTGPSYGISIKNNIVDNALGCGTPTYEVVNDAAAINVVAYDKKGNWVKSKTFTDITIDGNLATNCVRSGIRMENVNGGAISRNTVLNCGANPDLGLWYIPAGHTPSQIAAEFAHPLLAVNCASVATPGNTTNGSLVINRSFADGGYRVAPSSIVIAQGKDITTQTERAAGPSLPTTLAGLCVTVKDSAGISRQAELYSASPTQVVYIMPKDTAPGIATVTIGTTHSGGALISPVAPALFTTDSIDGATALATAVRTDASGKQILESVYQGPPFVPVPLDLGTPSDTLFITFQATGIRGSSSSENMVMDIGGIPLSVESMGQASTEPGKDYVKVKIPHSLIGSGLLQATLTVDGFTSNTVMIAIK